MRWNIDETFFDRINEVFICLVASTIRHCLKSWVTGVYVEPSMNEHITNEKVVSRRHGGGS